MNETQLTVANCDARSNEILLPLCFLVNADLADTAKVLICVPETAGDRTAIFDVRADEATTGRMPSWI